MIQRRQLLTAFPALMMLGVGPAAAALQQRSYQGRLRYAQGARERGPVDSGACGTCLGIGGSTALDTAGHTRELRGPRQARRRNDLDATLGDRPEGKRIIGAAQ